MERADLQQQLRRLSRAHPGEHPYSLALRVQVETGQIITGKLAKQPLSPLGPERP
ncbi:MAG: hypothetical protein NTU65_10795 [Cyanobacteria bacterium]|nr:hypothetical protein [Cyanobacteriota bacterium]